MHMLGIPATAWYWLCQRPLNRAQATLGSVKAFQFANRFVMREIRSDGLAPVSVLAIHCTPPHTGADDQPNLSQPPVHALSC